MPDDIKARRFVERTLDFIAVAGGWALLALAVLVGVEVALRKLFAFSIEGVDEIGGYVLAVTSVIGFIYCLANHGHIRVDVAFKFFTPAIRASLHLVAYLVLLAFSVLLAWRGGAVLFRSISLDAVAPTPLGTPLVLPQGIWFVGLLIFALMVLLLTAQLLRTFIKQGPAEVESRFHADRLEEEFAAEQRDAKRRADESAEPAA